MAILCVTGDTLYDSDLSSISLFTHHKKSWQRKFIAIFFKCLEKFVFQYILLQYMTFLTFVYCISNFVFLFAPKPPFYQKNFSDLSFIHIWQSRGTTEFNRSFIKKYCLMFGDNCQIGLYCFILAFLELTYFT